MKYKIIAKIVGPYLPDNFSLAGLNISKEMFKTPSAIKKTTIKDSTEKHLIKNGVDCRIAFNSHKLPNKKFDSSHIIKIEIEQSDKNHYAAYELAKIKIQQLIESLTIASFNIEKIRGGKKRKKDMTDIYQYQIVGIFTENSDKLKKIEIDDLTTRWNYFPESFSTELESLVKEVMTCNDETLRKAMEYMKRAKVFSFEYYSDLEVFLNSMKCIELFAKFFYPEGSIKSNNKFVSFKERMKGFDGKQGVFEILDIEPEYQDLTLKAWDCRNKLDIAHSSEYFKLISFPFPHEVNGTAYHFLMKYILYLKTNYPNCFYKTSDLDDDWWGMFV